MKSIFGGIIEKFEPTYLDSEEYYKQNQDHRSINAINNFAPSE